jgi:hypothetical protein
MPLDANLLYGTMVGSWIGHLAIPVVTRIAVRQLEFANWKIWFIIGCVGLSLLWQAMWLTVLQTSTCQGVKNVKGIATGTAIAAIITAVMVAIPVYVEPLRLIVSQLFISHKTLLTPAFARVNDALVESGTKVLNASLQTGGALTPDEYETQTSQEIALGTSYWAAFAGAYGIGIGSLFAASCV